MYRYDIYYYRVGKTVTELKKVLTLAAVLTLPNVLQLFPVGPPFFLFFISFPRDFRVNGLHTLRDTHKDETTFSKYLDRLQHFSTVNYAVPGYDDGIDVQNVSYASIITTPITVFR